MLLIGSLGISAVLYLAGLPFFFMFLFIPLLPFLSGGSCSEGNGDGQTRETAETVAIIKECPSCGWQTAGDERYCPYCAVQLIQRVEKNK
ncbi:MAG: hypothetical protein J5788_02655 [Methanomicrobium sp.]|nr:hypothetical protein [Methanomicrobium sp.]